MKSLRHHLPTALVPPVAALALGVWAANAPAQTPAPTALPKANCGANPEYPGRLASDKQKSQWRKEATAYAECYKKFAMDRRDLAMQYQEAANAAIDEYNAVVKDIQATVEAANKAQ